MKLYTRNKYGYWTAYCPSLTLYATGNSEQESLEKLRQEIDDHLEWESKYKHRVTNINTKVTDK